MKTKYKIGGIIDILFFFLKKKGEHFHFSMKYGLTLTVNLGDALS